MLDGMVEKAAVVIVCALLAGYPCAQEEAGPKTYYVDFVGGTDDADGLSPRTPFKRAPGDPAAQAKAAQVVLHPGDTVVFKGGVVYRGNIVCRWSGVEGQVITFRGDSKGQFGEGKAVIDGSEILAGWKRVASPSEVDGNPSWRQIWWTWVPSSTTIFGAHLCQAETMLWVAQDPNPFDPHYQDRPADFREIAPGAATPNTLTDTDVFVQERKDAWDGAYVAIWAQPNFTYYRKVTAFDPANHRITYETMTAPHYERPRGRFAMMNHLRLLDTPGEYVISSQSDGRGMVKLFLWPPAGDPTRTPVTISTRSVGFDINGASDITIEGFVIQKFVGRQPHRGVGVTNDVAGA